MFSDARPYIIIHGHFYQPPRHNPWTGAIPAQPSAAPFRDWTERITHECYRPNAFARIVDSRNYIEEIVNNYEYISFNIGPTLISYIKKEFPEIYNRIIEADKNSIRNNGGHGNAIAQVYNHIILPLARERDVATQIIWGVKDFERHFHRTPEAIWLAETAINGSVLDILRRFGFRYIVLSPFQASRARPLSGGSWTDVSKGKIDTTMPYRAMAPDGGYIDVFFYNHEVSHAISFQHLLTSSEKLMKKLLAIPQPDKNRPRALIACTDGESYGHHEKFGEMCLAYLIRRLAPAAGIRTTNFGHFLDICPPSWEVELDPGPAGEGTSWSCPHGVARWKDDCGCSTRGRPGWNQKWRAPLRAAIDYAAGTIWSVAERTISPLIDNMEEARNDYIDVIFDRTAESQNSFLRKHMRNTEPSPAQESMVLRLMEALYLCQLAYTSCGWFFADISGPEAKQNMLFAAKAMQLAQPFAHENLESHFAGLLEKAKSNIKEAGTGKDIYLREVKKSAIGPKEIAGNYAMASFITDEYAARTIYQHSITPLDIKRADDSETRLAGGFLRICDLTTKEEGDYAFLLKAPSLVQMMCHVSNASEIAGRSTWNLTDLEKAVKDKNNIYTIFHLFPEDREKLLKLAFTERMKLIDAALEDLFRQSEEVIELFEKMQIPPPAEVKPILCRLRIVKAESVIAAWEKEMLSGRHLKELKETLSDISLLCSSEEMKKIAGKLEKMLEKMIENITSFPDISLIIQLEKALTLITETRIRMDTARIAEKFYFLKEKMEKDASKDHVQQTVKGIAEKLGVVL